MGFLACKVRVLRTSTSDRVNRRCRRWHGAKLLVPSDPSGGLVPLPKRWGTGDCGGMANRLLAEDTEGEDKIPEGNGLPRRMVRRMGPPEEKRERTRLMMDVESCEY